MITPRERIVRERRRQLLVEGWSQEHDDQHDGGELLMAAMCYVAHARGACALRLGVPLGWPWDAKWWKPGTIERDLERAGALMLAEQSRLMRQRRATGHVEQKIALVLTLLRRNSRGLSIDLLALVAAR